MKRRGCTSCHIIEPVAGQYGSAGLCDACAESEKRRAERRSAAVPPQATPPRDQALGATVARLQGYLAGIARQYPDVWCQVDRLRALRGRELAAWPPWCFMPLAGAYAIASGGGEMDMGHLPDVAVIGALAAWRVTQGIYRYDATVMGDLWETPITGNIPGEILHALPEWCVYVETPGQSWHEAPMAGFFCYLEFDAKTSREELRLLVDDGQHLHGCLAVHLGGDLAAGLESAKQEAARQWALRMKSDPGIPLMERAEALRAQVKQLQEDEAKAKADGVQFPPDQLDILLKQREELKEYIGRMNREIAYSQRVQTVFEMDITKMAEGLAPMVSTVLYLCSTNAEILNRQTGRLRPRRPTLTKTKDGMRMFPAEKPVAWDIGYRLGAAIRHAMAREARSYGDGAHASPRAHIRRAHWHSFWTGAKAKPGTPAADRKLVLKWLPPIPVNVEEDTEVIPTVHAVE